MSAEVIAIIIAPLIAAVFISIYARWFTEKARLLTYLSNTFAMRCKTPEGKDFQVHTHTRIIKNRGRKPAINVKLGHKILPAFDIFPSIEHSVNQLPDGSKEILIPRIVPKQQIIVNYLYYPPLIWSQINTYTLSDEGYAKVVNMQLSPQPSKFLIGIFGFLSLMGISAIAYLLILLTRWIISII